LSNPAESKSPYETGLALVKSGHIDQAIGAFKKGLEIAPQDKVLLDATGAAYSLKGQLETARDYFNASLKVDPAFVPAKQNLGITLFALGRYAEAEDQLNSLQSQPGRSRAVANLFLGMIAEKRSDCKVAVLELESAGALLYQYPDAALSFGNCEYQIGNPQRTAQALSAFDQIPGKSSSQFEQAADLYTRLGQDRQALEELAKARAGKDQVASIEKKRAELFEKTGQLDEAQRALEAVVAAEPSADALLSLARVAKDRGALDVALKSLQRAAEVEPKREDSYLEFSSICSDHGNDTLALKTAEIGLSHIPNSYRLTVQKGAALEKLGHLNDAEDTLRKAMSMQKDNSIALLSLAVVQAHSGRTDEAEQTLATAIRQFPGNYYMYYFRGRLLSQFADANSSKSDLREGAMRSLEESIRLNPNYADSYYQLSELYLPTESKLTEEALQKCLRLNPSHLPAQYSLARLYLRTGRKEQGQALLARFKTQQRSEELQQQKQLRIDIAQE
jgi:tetratricopeptide (TPR) repeat protein